MQTFKFSEVNNEAQFTTSVSVDSVHTHVSIYLCMIGLGQLKELRGIQLFLLLGVVRVSAVGIICHSIVMLSTASR